ncbi:MAG: response regulator [Candidatus Magnetoovum sp. WYHC-5]|nr:response regulator [Candidatus Magnetoovum sp. WYHC-5]
MVKKKILFVDDEAIVCLSCKRVLEMGGYHVDTCISGADALKFLLENVVDILFIDIMMPGIGGIEVIGKVKKNWPAVYIVAMTGYCVDEVLEKVRQLNPNFFLEKPFMPHELLSIVESVI